MTMLAESTATQPEATPLDPMPVGKRATFRFGSNDRRRLQALRVMLPADRDMHVFRFALRLACNILPEQREQYVQRGIDAASDGRPGVLYVWLEEADRLLMEKVQQLYQLDTPSEAVRWSIKLAAERTAVEQHARAKKGK